MLKRFLGFSCGLILLLPNYSAAADHETGPSILARAAATGKAGNFVAATYLGGLIETLRDAGPFTVFVPTDAAFAKIPEQDLVALLQPNNGKKIAKILTYHVVKGRIPAKDITAKPRLKTLEGGFLTIAANSEGVGVNDATIVMTDIIGRNGIVHLIDRVLMPQADDLLEVAKSAGDFKILLKALKATGLDEALQGDGPFTVFAPTDEAFASLGKASIEDLLKDRGKLSDLLKLHVIPGEFSTDQLDSRKLPNTLVGEKLSFAVKSGRLLTVNGLTIVNGNIKARNGYIHVIDGVLKPKSDRNLMSVAEKAGNFSLLLKALEVAELSDTLREKGPFTVLAPTDEAFAKLGEGALADLLKDKAKLAEVLKLHVIPGVVKAQDIASGAGLKTLQGEKLKASIAKGRLVLNKSNVIDTDIDGGNGIIHVIDRVLVPSKSN